MNFAQSCFDSLSRMSRASYDSYMDSLMKFGSDNPITIKFRQMWVDYSQIYDILFDIYASCSEED